MQSRRREAVQLFLTTNIVMRIECALLRVTTRMSRKESIVAGKLRSEIRQSRPFDSIEEEVVLTMLRTADLLAAPLTDLLREAGLGISQYNMLRILRGSRDDALTCGEVSERMVRRDPDVTRLLDRLEKGGLVERSRDVADRRVVRAKITAEGLALLERLDGPVAATVKRTLSHMPASRLEMLNRLLDEARSGGESG
jgi:DNA-binding MarR family transcriptional regulator